MGHGQAEAGIRPGGPYQCVAPGDRLLTDRRAARLVPASHAGVISAYVGRVRRRDEIVRKYLFRAMGRLTSRVAIDSGDCRYYVSTSDMVGRQLYLTGHFELEILADALAILKKQSGRSLDNKVFVDIGANIGTTVIPAVKSFGARHGYAFEPEVTNVKLLRQNVIENDLEELVTVVPVALSDVNEDGILEIASTNWGDHRVRKDPRQLAGRFGEQERPTITVRLRRFDDVCRELNLDLTDIGLVWMDVQGHEAYVFSGAESLLRSDVPVVTEYWPYGLRRAGGTQRLHEIIASHYREVVDIRASSTDKRTVRISSDDIASLETKYSEDFTDLMLLK